MACQKPIDKVDKLLVLGMQRPMNIQKMRCQNPRSSHVETVCCLYHQKKDFISVPYELKNDDYLKQHKTNFSDET